MSDVPEFQRGDVVLLDYPFTTDPSQKKRRPAVIVQNDVGNRFSPNLIVANITSQLPSPHRRSLGCLAASGERLAKRVLDDRGQRSTAAGGKLFGVTQELVIQANRGSHAS